MTQKKLTTLDSKETNDICNVPFISEVSRASVPDNILDAFHSLVRQPITPDEISKHYVGKLNRYYYPFSVSYYGAYPLMSQVEILEMKMERANEEDDFKNYQREKVFESLKNYARGFQHGFDKFLDEKIVSPTSLSNTEDFKVKKIMDYINQPFKQIAFSESYGKGRDIFEGWYRDGIQSGYFYRAWYLILDNHQLFEPYFKKDKNNSEQSINSAEEFAKWLNNIDNNNYEELISGFESLESYINKNVHENVNANRERLQQLKRNLTNWQYQIKSNFIEPIKETISYNSEALSRKRTEAINKILHKIEMALDIIKLRLEGKTHQAQKTKSSNNFSAPIVALFCQLVNQSGLILKIEDESVECYCKRICLKFGLEYTDRVKQRFSNSENKKNKDKVKELILPKIDQKASEVINKYLNKEIR